MIRPSQVQSGQVRSEIQGPESLSKQSTSKYLSAHKATQNPPHVSLHIRSQAVSAQPDNKNQIRSGHTKEKQALCHGNLQYFTTYDQSNRRSCLSFFSLSLPCLRSSQCKYNASTINNLQNLGNMTEADS